MRLGSQATVQKSYGAPVRQRQQTLRSMGILQVMGVKALGKNILSQSKKLTRGEPMFCTLQVRPSVAYFVMNQKTKEEMGLPLCCENRQPVASYGIEDFKKSFSGAA